MLSINPAINNKITKRNPAIKQEASNFPRNVGQLKSIFIVQQPSCEGLAFVYSGGFYSFTGIRILFFNK